MVNWKIHFVNNLILYSPSKSLVFIQKHMQFNQKKKNHTHTCNKINALQRIIKLNKKMLIQEPMFKLLGRDPLAIHVNRLHI